MNPILLAIYFTIVIINILKSLDYAALTLLPYSLRVPGGNKFPPVGRYRGAWEVRPLVTILNLFIIFYYLYLKFINLIGFFILSN